MTDGATQSDPLRVIEGLRSQFFLLRAGAISAVQGVPRFHQGEAHRVISRLRSARTIGVDNWSADELKSLSKLQVGKLTQVLNDCEVRMAPPIQTMYNPVSLLPKHEEADRPIGISSAFYLLWSRLRCGDVNPWEAGFV